MKIDNSILFIAALTAIDSAAALMEVL